jgi:hypothetical protein
MYKLQMLGKKLKTEVKSFGIGAYLNHLMPEIV